MKRRTLLQSLAAGLALKPLARLHASAAPAPPADLTDANIATLKAIADVVLPAALGPAGRDSAVRNFVVWVRNYKEGADRGHGYGNSTISGPSGASPAARYPPQFAALDAAAAAAQRGATLATLPVDTRRVVIEHALNLPTPVTRLPARPTGNNLIADFLGFFCNSADGFDLAYNAAIGRDTCRGLEGSENAPDPLGKREAEPRVFRPGDMMA